jgi:RNA polymerase sigma-70 factor (ECF subfamily)
VPAYRTPIGLRDVGDLRTLRLRKNADVIRRRNDAPDDYRGVGSERAAGAPHGGLLELYDAALPRVYGYLLARCGGRPLAEDLTAETFLAAVSAVRRSDPPVVTVAWLIGVARHKLVDHWRRVAREERVVRAVGASPEAEDPWDEHLDAMAARATLDRLGPHHRAALTLRYLDDLSVPQVAALLGRTLHATEALLVRARAEFRCAYDETRREAGRG